jgi:hypothetical protein
VSCDAPPDAFLEARLAGALDTELHWQAADMDCDGMRRPDGLGLRIRFQGTAAGQHLTLVFAAPRLAEGESAHAVPVNVTLIREGGPIYGTRGEERCLLDEVTQAPLPTPLPVPDDAPRRWRVEARGFCLAPARAVGGNDAILVSRFDFRGQLAWDPDPPAAPPPPLPPPGF